MNLPILERLKDGVRFDFETLADNCEQTQTYWDWWWEEKYKEGTICRPETISDDDPILIETIEKTTVDLGLHYEFWNEFLLEKIALHKISRWELLSRSVYRNFMIRIIGANSIKLPGRPQIVFAGGGYGSGKTTIINKLAEAGKLPLAQSYMVGVDYFKLYVPEFSLIQSVSDGRSSFTVQKECKMLADQLFDILVKNGHSFIWDSSMSAKEETLKKIKSVKDQGYELSLVAVLTPVEVAIRQSMSRARQTRRFPHFEALPASHINFRKHFMDYVPLFEDVVLFANTRKGCDIPIVIGKKQGKKELDIFDQPLFNSLMAVQ